MGPYSVNYLTNQPHSVLKCAGLYLTSAGVKGSCLVLPCKSVEYRHWSSV